MTSPKAKSVRCFFTSPSLARAFDTHAHSNAGPSAGPFRLGLGLQLFCAVLHLRPENVYCPCVEAIVLRVSEGAKRRSENRVSAERRVCDQAFTRRVSSVWDRAWVQCGAPGYGCSIRGYAQSEGTYVSAQSVGADECTIRAHAGGSTEGVLDDYPCARAAVPPLIEDTRAFIAFPSAGGQQERHEEEKVGRDHSGHTAEPCLPQTRERDSLTQTLNPGIQNPIL